MNQTPSGAWWHMRRQPVAAALLLQRKGLGRMGWLQVPSKESPGKRDRGRKREMMQTHRQTQTPGKEGGTRGYGIRCIGSSKSSLPGLLLLLLLILGAGMLRHLLVSCHFRRDQDCVAWTGPRGQHARRST